MSNEIRIEDVAKYKSVYIVAFYDGYVNGSKYNTERLNTEYMSFSASVGTKFFKTHDDARLLADKLNKAKGNGSEISIEK